MEIVDSLRQAVGAYREKGDLATAQMLIDVQVTIIDLRAENVKLQAKCRELEVAEKLRTDVSRSRRRNP